MDIPSKLHDFHGVVDGLFEEISVFLSQFRIYQRIEQFADIDPDLNDTIHRLMISFVNICALSIALRNGGKWRIFKRDAKKVLLDDDSDVAKELDGFKYLVQKQGNIRDTLTLEHVLKSEDKLSRLLNEAAESQTRLADIEKGVSGIGKGVNDLTTAEGERKSEQLKKDQLSKILKKLAVKDEAIQADKTIFNESWSQSIEGSGSWLRDQSQYTDWLDAKTDAKPLLLLTGDTNSGKSFLATTIIHALHDKYGEKGSVRTSIAYHFFPRWSEKIGQDPRPAETALKCLALQVAEQNAVYRRTLANFVDLKEDAFFRDSSCGDLWDILKFADPKADCTYFLLLDGIDQCGNNARSLLKVLNDLQELGADHVSVRVLGTGTPETFQDDDVSSSSLDFTATPTISSEQNNEPDIRKYIERQLKQRDLLQGNNAETVRFRTSIYDKVPDLVHGNFFKVQNTLDKIDDAIASDGTSLELERILDEANQDKETIGK